MKLIDKYIFNLIIYFNLILLAGCGTKLPTVNTAQQVDLTKYAGTWYEIASLPNFFQKKCQCTTANYVLKKDFVEVTNSCRKGILASHWTSAHAKAFSVPNSNNSKLTVQFFWPLKGDYWILYVRPDYQYAVVGTPNRKYLWLLARKPSISAEKLNELKAIAIKQDYPLEKLALTNQSCYK